MKIDEYARKWVDKNRIAPNYTLNTGSTYILGTKENPTPMTVSDIYIAGIRHGLKVAKEVNMIAIRYFGDDKTPFVECKAVNDYIDFILNGTRDLPEIKSENVHEGNTVGECGNAVTYKWK